MQESDTYLAILDEGAEKQARKSILIAGEKRIGPPPEGVLVALSAITDLQRLEFLLGRVLEVHNWQELLDMP